jgi:hypothetical protein
VRQGALASPGIGYGSNGPIMLLMERGRPFFLDRKPQEKAPARWIRKDWQGRGRCDDANAVNGEECPRPSEATPGAGGK